MFKCVASLGTRVASDGTVDTLLSNIGVNVEFANNDCCGSRLIQDQSFIFSRQGNSRDFGDPYFWTHTLGIRMWPGKVKEIPTYPTEEISEVALGGDVLTIAYVAKWMELATNCERDSSNGKYTSKSSNRPEYIEYRDTKQELWFPVFTGWREEVVPSAEKRASLLRNYLHYGYTQTASEKMVEECHSRFRHLKDKQEAGTHVVFTIATYQLKDLKAHLDRYKMTEDIVFEKTDICNLNYRQGDNPRLAIIVVKGK